MSMPRVAAFAWLAAGFLAGGSTATAQSFTFERSFPATTASRLEVATNRGKITVRAGTTAELVVTGRVSVRVGWNVPRGAVAMARTTADDPPIVQTDDIVRLGIPRDARTRRAVTIAYEVYVPAGTAVATQSESGETRVEGVRGAVSVRTQSGAVTLADLGQTRIETGSGAVSVDGAGPLCRRRDRIERHHGRRAARRVRRLDAERPRAHLRQTEPAVASHDGLQRH